ncbi:hypothetical protein LEM8419_00254 [Neolewinella maritima]|uniref:Polysaccharide export protein n=1 Tax=Neolewinella maritima TaxID=1383882 RepID=A0ABN8EYS9_9BACT|nr:polysaccharide biosynthesis/export family protein [Neolewinella maritima]CAH0998959.1 hypothetical protein LEM8419_00254 [Neolewinella maritima]
MNSTFGIVLSFLCLALASSCVSYQELVNFEGEDLTTISPEMIDNNYDLTVQPEDLLKIDVSSLNPDAALPFNIVPQNTQMGQQGAGGGNGSSVLELTTGYFVDRAGYIDFPVLGAIQVEGLTLTQVKDRIVDRLENGYLKQPVINIRYLNFKITILGAVTNPGTVRLSNKRITVLEALGMAGDLTNYANRNNILVIREEDGQRTFTYLDLQSSEVFSSDYFYLQQNDVIYVQPIRAVVATVADPGQRIVQYVSAGLALISIFVAFTR